MARARQEELQALRDEGKTVWSFSRLGSFHNCQYGYYKSYVDKNRDRGLPNIYSIMGSKIHDIIENIYNEQMTKEDLIAGLNEGLIDCEMLGVKFPTELIENSWKADMNHFVTNFSKMENPLKTESFILFEIAPDIWIQGYVDAEEYKTGEDGLPNNHVDIIDWKTSSKFNKHKLLESGRQLVLYKMARESQGYKVDNVAWFMMKYVYVCNLESSGKKKSIMCSRRKWVKERKSVFTTALRNAGYDDFMIAAYLDEAIANNNIDNFPEEVKSKYWLEDCLLTYDVNDGIIEETKTFVLSTIEMIESKDHDDESQWRPTDIKNNDFYCAHLCNHRKSCKFYAEYVKSLELDDKDDVIGEMDKLFGI